MRYRADVVGREEKCAEFVYQGDLGMQWHKLLKVSLHFSYYCRFTAFFMQRND